MLAAWISGRASFAARPSTAARSPHSSGDKSNQITAAAIFARASSSTVQLRESIRLMTALSILLPKPDPVSSLLAATARQMRPTPTRALQLFDVNRLRSHEKKCKRHFYKKGD